MKKAKAILAKAVPYVAVAIVLVSAVGYSYWAISAAAYREALGGSNVVVSVYDPSDGKFYALKGEAGAVGVPNVSMSTSGEDTHSVGTITGSAALVVAANAERKQVSIQNALTSTGVLYLGVDNTVTTSGANIGIALIPGGSITAISSDDWYGISDATATVVVRETE